MVTREHYTSAARIARATGLAQPTGNRDVVRVPALLTDLVADGWGAWHDQYNNEDPPLAFERRIAGVVRRGPEAVRAEIAALALARFP